MESIRFTWLYMVLFKFKFIFINIYFNSNFFHFIKRLDRRYKNVRIIIIIIIKDKC